MLTPEVKTSWIEALKSGLYVQQHKCSLRTEDNRYCCLGVLADILNPNLWRYKPHCGEYRWAHNNAYLPNHVLDGDIQSKLAGINDGGTSFSEIADYIEQSSNI
jgi:hypothetical protein